MSRLAIGCVVEGHGEVEALPVLLRRVIKALCPNHAVQVLPPCRGHRSSLPKPGELERFVSMALKPTGFRGGVLILLDADKDLPCDLAPKLLSRAKAAARDCPASVVLAKCEYEAWFLASANGLAGKFKLPANLTAPPNCEAIRDAKGWLDHAWAGADRYSPTLHQADLTRLINIDLARQNSPSFDKLCRDVERLCREVAARFGDT